MRGSRFLILVSIFLWASALVASGFEDWINFQKYVTTRDLLANIAPQGSAPGTVCASPSKIYPNYFFDWTRDGAIVFQEVLQLYRKEKDPAQKKKYFDLLMDFVRSSKRKQLTPNRSGPPENTGLGEPKWNMDLSPYEFDWGRPQNDGPALRASLLIRFVQTLMDEGMTDLAREIYDGRNSSLGVLKKDLEFVSHYWQNPSFELWEEVSGHHFSTRYQQHRALADGAALAKKFGDFGAADWYEKQALEIYREILNHWREDRGYFIQTTERIGGLSYKMSNLDSGVILAVLDNGGDPFLQVSDDRLLATAEALRSSMERLYEINKRTTDSHGDPVAPAIGRYPEDKYNGYDSWGLGNPWFLITAGFAKFSYDVAYAWLQKGQIEVTRRNLAFLRAWTFSQKVDFVEGETISQSDPRFRLLLDGLFEMGDRFLRRWRLHSPEDGSTSEQMNRDNGRMQGAEKLTWNCAAFLSATGRRADLMRRLRPAN